MQRYCVVELDEKGKIIGVMAGLGRNKGRWDTECYSRRTAQRWAKECRDDLPGRRFAVDTSP